MRQVGSLERGYRRLLRCYPAGHRDQHGKEMLGVLLAGARPGQRWPGLAESANLIAGARAHPALGTAAVMVGLSASCRTASTPRPSAPPVEG